MSLLGGTTCDRYQDSLVVDDARKWMECNLTYDEANVKTISAKNQWTPHFRCRNSPDTSTGDDTKGIGRANVGKLEGIPAYDL